MELVVGSISHLDYIFFGLDHLSNNFWSSFMGFKLNETTKITKITKINK
jgi:hypothetical protein